ncbi:TIGR02206 family membrane protein [Weissella muntiaci]|uniref:TIGR02206 family membrane protein n=1 Tax=Weissella muntiaci TaxID=2508881 RepID=A0A6C2C4X8_9LACO|nr:YwaF family protein [Weissella muntiaci]TYC48732.1 TIGR02206 family membrane protein [Weissella muntiaci]
MFRYYFTYEDQLPAGMGFSLFGTRHLVTLLLVGILVVTIIIVYRGGTESKRQNIRYSIAGVLVGLELFRQIYLSAAGVWTPKILPLDLCGWGLILVAIDAVHPSKFTRESFYALTWWAALAAEVFPNWTAYPILNEWVLQSIIIHALLIAYCLMIFFAGEYRPNVHNLWRVVLFLIVLVPATMMINGLLKTNFLFLSVGSPGSPLAPIQTMTGTWYIPTLIGLVSILWVILYVPWSIHKRKDE